MNKESKRVHGNFEQHKKRAWGKLPNDAIRITGSRQEVYGKLQKHYGYSVEQAEKALAELQFYNKREY